MRTIDQTAVRPLLTALTLLQCAEPPHPARNEGWAQALAVNLFIAGRN